MNPRYVGWVLLKSAIGSVLMCDSMSTAILLAPGLKIAAALLVTETHIVFFVGFFVVFSAFIGGFGIITENYHWKGELELARTAHA